MKTQGEIESAIGQGMARFEQEYMHRGPKDIHAHHIGDLLVVRPQGILTAAEQHLVKVLAAAKGRDLLKQVRPQLKAILKTISLKLDTGIYEVSVARCVAVLREYQRYPP